MGGKEYRTVSLRSPMKVGSITRTHLLRDDSTTLCGRPVPAGAKSRGGPLCGSCRACRGKRPDWELPKRNRRTGERLVDRDTVQSALAEFFAGGGRITRLPVTKVAQTQRVIPRGYCASDFWPADEGGGDA